MASTDALLNDSQRDWASNVIAAALKFAWISTGQDHLVEQLCQHLSNMPGSRALFPLEHASPVTPAGAHLRLTFYLQAKGVSVWIDVVGPHKDVDEEATQLIHRELRTLPALEPYGDDEFPGLYSLPLAG